MLELDHEYGTAHRGVDTNLSALRLSMATAHAYGRTKGLRPLPVDLLECRAHQASGRRKEGAL